jgi:hypothetical protein
MPITKAIVLLQGGSNDPEQLSVLIREFSAVISSATEALREAANGRLEWTGKLTDDAWERLDTLRHAFAVAKNLKGTSVAITPNELMIVVDNDKDAA